jgi:antitoxin (DNA-binding transcriptional repressor) of toxin-antitoxin stability system
MLTTVSCSQARRRLIALVAQGHSLVITKNGRAFCRLEGIEAIQLDHGASCKASLWPVSACRDRQKSAKSSRSVTLWVLRSR